MSIVWALWFMNATIARIDAMPRSTPTATDTLGMTGLPWPSSGARTDRRTTRQKVKVPTTSPITRLLNGSRNSPLTTRGEYWLDASWMVSSDTENAMPATVIVAPATVLSTARALWTVEVKPSGSRLAPLPRASSRASPAWPSTIPAMTQAIGTTNRLPRSRSRNAEIAIFMAILQRPVTVSRRCDRSYARGRVGGTGRTADEGLLPRREPAANIPGDVT